MSLQKNILSIYDRTLNLEEKCNFLRDARSADGSLDTFRKTMLNSTSILYNTAGTLGGAALFFKNIDGICDLIEKVQPLSNMFQSPMTVLSGVLAGTAATVVGVYAALVKPVAHTKFMILGGEKALEEYKESHEDLYVVHLEKKPLSYIEQVTANIAFVHTSRSPVRTK